MTTERKSILRVDRKGRWKGNFLAWFTHSFTWRKRNGQNAVWKSVKSFSIYNSIFVFYFFFFTKYRYKNDIDDRQKITHLLNIGVISMHLLETQVWKNVGIQDTAFEMKNPYLLLNAVFYKLYLATQKHNIWHWKAKATYIFSTFIVGTLFIAY